MSAGVQPFPPPVLSGTRRRPDVVRRQMTAPSGPDRRAVSCRVMVYGRHGSRVIYGRPGGPDGGPAAAAASGDPGTRSPIRPPLPSTPPLSLPPPPLPPPPPPPSLRYHRRRRRRRRRRPDGCRSSGRSRRALGRVSVGVVSGAARGTVDSSEQQPGESQLPGVSWGYGGWFDRECVWGGGGGGRLVCSGDTAC